MSDRSRIIIEAILNLKHAISGSVRLTDTTVYVAAGRPVNRTLNTFRTGFLKQDTYNATEAVLLNEVLFQGDIRLRVEEAREILNSISKRRRKRKITANQDKWWTLPIPYRFDDKLSFKTGVADMTEKGHILEGVRHWEENTCIRFQEVPADTTLSPVLLFRKHTGCWSYVGKENAFKLQEISVGEGCFSLGIVVHELGHAIGFWHEHSRPDRDDHIRVKYENVRVGEDFNFLKESWRYLDNLDVPYDIGSVMHYGATAFSVGSKATIETLEPLEQNVLGQRQMLSFYDAKQANLAYCKASCGGVVQIEGRETYTIQTPGYPFHYQPNVQCNWLIKAANDKVVNLMPIQDGFISPQPSCDSFGGNVCDEEYTEIKYRVSMAKTGASFLWWLRGADDDRPASVYGAGDEVVSEEVDIQGVGFMSSLLQTRGMEMRILRVSDSFHKP
ncbi:zinc metalloproteinase nas-36-like [Haliotis rubra]|uniref:zinc metalloproteinase nas-36-like n=1 Tax=Haliotis rubra TaxID=36100 RepID=UPI001EE61E16|nr:zinc metalloproteinase nas-36-like [Haliotis rubra]